MTKFIILLSVSLLIQGCAQPAAPDLKPLAFAFIVLGVCGLLSSYLWSQAIERSARARLERRHHHARRR